VSRTFLDYPAPRWFTIEPQRPFLADLAAGLARTLSPLAPEAAASALILLPTRRAGRELAAAFVTASPGPAALLPQILALGDLDEGEPPFEAADEAMDLLPAVDPQRRRFELARLVVENEALLERRLDAAGALELADALAAFLDTCQMEEAGDPRVIETLVEGDLARHWRISGEFLGLALVAWPARLAALGLMDITARRVALLRHLAARWSAAPPESLVIAAGSTGAAPAAADLLAVVATLPRGCVILPGLDRSLSDDAWTSVDEQHPQARMKRLLECAYIPRSQVHDWVAGDPTVRGRWRQRLVNEALRPADAAGDWLGQIEALRAEGAAAGLDPVAEGLKGLFLTAAANEEETAALAAILARESLETPGRKCALVTPDAALARRVSARLERWGVIADSSAGQPLARLPVAVLASLVARFVADPTDPVTLLGVLKHPLTRLGRAVTDSARRTLEQDALRGPRSASWEALIAKLERRQADDRGRGPPSPARVAALGRAIDVARVLREALEIAARPFVGETALASEAARALAASMEALARGPGGGLGQLWGGQAGEAAGALVSRLIGESDGLPPVTKAGFSDLLDGLLARELVRPAGATHPRLKIMGVLEGRLMSADRLILAGLEEGIWPQAAPLDPFLSRPMRAQLGLPPPERRIGLSAHDFAQAAAAPEVILIHSERRAGAPAVASRWLWRLRVLASGAGAVIPSRDDALAWARRLDAPIADPPPALGPAPRPRPAPPVVARPRRLSVTGVELWVRDPYALYARDILRLRPLEPPDQAVDALARGSAIHRAVERFASDWPGELPEDAETVIEGLLNAALVEAGIEESRLAREQALARNLAPWFTAFERGRRLGARLHVEAAGEFVFPARAGPFTLAARADRLEQRADRVDIIDFKTGAPPSDKDVLVGAAPQLSLTGAIIAAGGFDCVGPATPGELVYVRLRGTRKPGEERKPAEAHEGAGVAAEALAGLKRRIEAYDKATTPYLSWALPKFRSDRGGDYDHLARFWEWCVIGDLDSEGAP